MSLTSWCVRHAPASCADAAASSKGCSRVHRPAAPSIGRSAVHLQSPHLFYLVAIPREVSQPFGLPDTQSVIQLHLIPASSSPRSVFTTKKGDSSIPYHILRTAILSPNAHPLMQLAWPPPMSPSVLVPKTHPQQHPNSNSSGRSHRFPKCPTFRRTPAPAPQPVMDLRQCCAVQTLTMIEPTL